MEIRIDDNVPNEFTDAQKKTTMCEWFVREQLKFAECFIRAELNHVPQNIKVTIEKPIDFKGELIDFADILIEYDTPEKLHESDEWINRMLSIVKSMTWNDIIEQNVSSAYPRTNEAFDKKKTKSLFSVDYTAPYLLENEFEKIEETKKRLMKEYQDAASQAIRSHRTIQYKKFRKKCLLISVVPTIETLKEDINESIRRIKAWEFYLKNVTQKYVVYWGMTDNDIQKYLQHEDIGLSGLYEAQYYIDEELKNIDGKVIPF